MKRPLFVVGFSFGGCLLAARWMGFHMALLAAGLSALLFILVLAIRALRGKITLLAVLLAAVAAFFMFSAQEYRTVRPLQALDGQQRTATVWLTDEVARTDHAVLYHARVVAGDLPEQTKLALWVANDDEAPERYNYATASLQLTATDEQRADGVYLQAWAASDWQVTLTEERPFGARLDAWRERVVALSDTYIGGEPAALIRAICFGDKSGLSREVKTAFSDAGLSHLMAVSGFHMSVVALGFFGLLRRLTRRRTVAALCSLPIPVLFAVLTGFSFSALRAGVMCLLVMLAEVTHRQTDAKNSLGGAVLLLLLVDLRAIDDLGFLLSVAATLGIVCTASWGRARPADASWIRRFGHRLWSALRVTLAATVATMPILALTFGTLPVLSLVSNLLGEPLASGIVVCGCVGTALMCVPALSFLAAPFYLVAGVLARLLQWWAEAIASCPLAVWLLDAPYLLLWVCAVPFALILGWHLLRGRGLRLTAMLLVVALTAATLCRTIGLRGVVTLTAVDQSVGAAVLLERDGRYGLVLTDPAAEMPETFLSRQGIDRLDFVVYTERVEKPVREPVVADCVLTAGDAAATMTFWNDCTAAWQDGWLCLTLGTQRVLVCPSAGDAAVLSPSERTADLLIFDRTPPQHITSVAAKEAVLCCPPEDMQRVTRAVPWGAYPVAWTAQETVVRRMRI